MSDNVDIKIMIITKGYLIMIKQSIYQGDITIINVYTHHISTSKNMKQTFTYLKGEVDNCTIILGDSLSS